MASIAFLLLCHRDPDGVAAQARALVAGGDSVTIHFDARARPAVYARLRSAIADEPRIALTRRRIACGWGEWSLVAATLEAVRTAFATFTDATHFYLISGDCAPIKTAEYAHARLDAEDADHIESFDYFTSGWIKTGLREERLIYRHVFNERANKRLFYAALGLQQRLGLERPTPEGLRIMIGSQWWCLRRETIRRILDFLKGRPDVIRFFRTTWIPDETFFQTLVPHLVADAEIRRQTLTFLIFTDYGMPVTFHADQEAMLLGQSQLFARKISPDAISLRERLRALWAERGRDFAIAGDGRRLFEFLTRRGREGRRHAPRFWERGASIGTGRELLMVVCKKWHVARRLAAAIGHETGIPHVGYLFSEDHAGVPELGGIGASLAKRNRHRRAVLRMIFDHFGSDRLVICLDPSQLDLMRDFAADDCRARVLEIDCHLSDAYLEGHACRIGIIGKNSPEPVRTSVLPAIRAELDHEAALLRTAGLPWITRIREDRGAGENAVALAAFLGIGQEEAGRILAEPRLYED